mmetsp:Transcript_18970/g.32500  ORF Transcript_18970/g.32500 Transcript_18970/m.32500 type:complete len:223 (-) Transcript_18970:35-703(-)
MRVATTEDRLFRHNNRYRISHRPDNQERPATQYDGNIANPTHTANQRHNHPRICHNSPHRCILPHTPTQALPNRSKCNNQNDSVPNHCNPARVQNQFFESTSDRSHTDRHCHNPPDTNHKLSLVSSPQWPPAQAHSTAEEQARTHPGSNSWYLRLPDHCNPGRVRNPTFYNTSILDHNASHDCNCLDTNHMDCQRWCTLRCIPALEQEVDVEGVPGGEKEVL